MCVCVCVCVPENRALTDLGDHPVFSFFFFFFRYAYFTGAELFGSRALKSITQRGKKQIEISREYFFSWMVGRGWMQVYLVDYRLSFIGN